jgi:hypothetical protein
MGEERTGDRVLTGSCAKCGQAVARVVEASQVDSSGMQRGRTMESKLGKGNKADSAGMTGRSPKSSARRRRSQPTQRLSHEEERGKGARTQNKPDRAPPHGLNPFVCA